MMMISPLLTIWVALAAGPSDGGLPSTDPCVEEVPADLAQLLMRKFPRYRMPAQTDQGADTLAAFERAGGKGCFSISLGDFDGDGRSDVAIELPNRDGKSAQLVVALHREPGWVIQALPDHCKQILGCMVSAVPPGTFRRSSIVEGSARDKGEQLEIIAKHQSIASGIFEGPERVYVYEKGRWQYVWTSD